jgi:hypothetical protein
MTVAGLGITVAGLGSKACLSGYHLPGLGITSGARIAAAYIRQVFPLLIAFITPALVKLGR